MSKLNAGFSLEEVKAAGLNVAKLRFNHVKVDTRRSSCKDVNIELLKKMELKEIPKATKNAEGKKVEKKEKTEKSAESTKKVNKLEELEGIDDKILQKLKDLGIDSKEKFLNENVKELAKITKLTQKQINSWRTQLSD